MALLAGAVAREINRGVQLNAPTALMAKAIYLGEFTTYFCLLHAFFSLLFSAIFFSHYHLD